MNKVLAFIAVWLFSISAFSEVRVMTFNTTCSYLCEKGKFDKFKYRKHWIVDTIKRSNPDLISMQEVLNSSQLKWFKKKLKDYHLIYHRKFFIFRFADPALFIRKDRFTIKKYGGFWLGPRGYRFSLGWKLALPRRVQWTRIYDRYEDKQLYFVGSHFDNRKKNKEKSARVLVKAFAKVKHPIIFAADTNLKPAMDGFKFLQEHFIDTYDEADEIEFVKNSDTGPDDSCNLEKGKTFPTCRVDHIMLSKQDTWSVSKWGVDQYKYGKNNRFTSDHRAIFADIKY